MTWPTVTITLTIEPGTVNEAAVVVGNLRAAAAFHRARHRHGVNDELQANRDADTLDAVADRIIDAGRRLEAASAAARAEAKKRARAEARAQKSSTRPDASPTVPG